MSELRLLSQPCAREGFERYTDLFLVWTHNGKTFCVRVNPQFRKDFKLLLAHSEHIERGEAIEKYL